MDPFADGIKTLFAGASPHMKALGYEITDVGDGLAVATVPYNKMLVGDPRTGVLHGGVVTSLLDTTGGAAVLMKVREPIPIATLDLRIDYLRPAVPHQMLRCRVECFKASSQVAFTRGFAYEDDLADPVASMAATYMLRTTATRRATPDVPADTPKEGGSQ